MAYTPSYQMKIQTPADVGIKVYTLLAELLAAQNGLEITDLNIRPISPVNDSGFKTENGSLIWQRNLEVVS